ncbi:Transcription factor TFIIB [Corchorus olitorius]|uniref:Transcription factor TFIIB n=1 Tax=Corchorus olitorius TaxID=93759 RepID=A0A1R3G4C5_9ROSI|nr:Transcription factor TFIIB [Corchorus olitorius]
MEIYTSHVTLLLLFRPLGKLNSPEPSKEISITANVPQKEIGNYIKILGKALKLSQPINSNSISVHMPRFCTLLQLNKSAQELATHIGKVVINKCFCTRRNPISISAAAIYLSCQLEDKHKTRDEICKVTGLTEVTLRKVYKEVLENWKDLLPSNFTPTVPLEKAFPTTTIAIGRSSVPRVDPPIDMTSSFDIDKQQDSKAKKSNEMAEPGHQAIGKGDTETNGNPSGVHIAMLKQPQQYRQPWLQFCPLGVRPPGDKTQQLPSEET